MTTHRVILSLMAVGFVATQSLWSNPPTRDCIGGRSTGPAAVEPPDEILTTSRPAAAGVTSTTDAVTAPAAGLAMTARVTFYCQCRKCCGPNAKGITATGHHIQPGDKIVAVDPKVIRLGSVVTLDGVAYKALDTGSGVKGLHIDVLVTGPDAHARARTLGVRVATINVEK